MLLEIAGKGEETEDDEIVEIVDTDEEVVKVSMSKFSCRRARCFERNRCQQAHLTTQ